jgi:small subunit ribosomal protein S21
MEIKVIDNDVEKAIKILKNKLNKSGLFRERRHYEKPSVRKKKKHAEALKRQAKKRRFGMR